MRTTIDSIERGYIHYYVVVSIVAACILGQIPHVSFVLSASTVVGALFILLLRAKEKFTRTSIHPAITSLWVIILGLLLINGHEASDIKLAINMSIQCFILASTDKYQSKECLLSNLSDILKLYIYCITTLNVIGLILFIYCNTFVYNDLYFIKFHNSFIGFYLNPNSAGYASYLCIAFCCILRVLDKKTFLFPIFISIICLVLSLSRGALLLLVIFFVLYFLRKSSSNNKIILVTIGLICIATLYICGCLTLDVIGNLYNKGSSGDALNGRSLLWQEGFYAFIDNIWTGTGFGRFTEYMLNQNSSLEYMGLIGGGLHNFYLQIGITFGVVGLLTYLVFFCYLLRCKTRYNGHEFSLVFSIIKIIVFTICLMGIVEIILLTTNTITTFFWLFSGFILSTKTCL